MTSRANRPISTIAPAALAAVALVVFGTIEQAAAQGAPAVVDQYRPAAPGDPNPDATRDQPDGDGDDGAGNPGGDPGAGTTLPGGVIPPPLGDPENAAGLVGSDDAGDVRSSFAIAGTTGRGQDAPVVAGYPLTLPVVAAIVAIAIGLALALGAAMWRRFRGDGALPDAG